MDKLLEYNDKIMGAPGGVLLFLALIGLIQLLRVWQHFPNKAIPVITAIIGCGVWVLIGIGTEAIDMEKTKIMHSWLWWVGWFGRNICIGTIIPVASYIAHKFVMKQIEKRLGSFNTQEFIKPEEKTPEPKP